MAPPPDLGFCPGAGGIGTPSDYDACCRRPLLHPTPVRAASGDHPCRRDRTVLSVSASLCSSGRHLLAGRCTSGPRQLRFPEVPRPDMVGAPAGSCSGRRWPSPSGSAMRRSSGARSGRCLPPKSRQDPRSRGMGLPPRCSGTLAAMCRGHRRAQAIRSRSPERRRFRDAFRRPSRPSARG